MDEIKAASSPSSTWVVRWEVPSHSDPSKTYTVARNNAGEYGCSCPVWVYRRKLCKHIKQVASSQIQPGRAIPQPITIQPAETAKPVHVGQLSRFALLEPE